MRSAAVTFLAAAALLVALPAAPVARVAPVRLPPGMLYVSDATAFGVFNGGIFRVDPVTGARTTLSENNAPPGAPIFETPTSMAFDANGDLIVAESAWVAGANGTRYPAIIRVDPATGARTLISDSTSSGPAMDNPDGVAVEADGHILVTDYDGGPGAGHGSVLRVDPVTGARTLLSRNGRPAGGPRFDYVGDIVLDSTGAAIVTSGGGSTASIIRVDPVTGVRTLISQTGNPAGGPDLDSPEALAAGPGNTVYVTDRGRYSPQGVVAVEPHVLAVDTTTGVRTTVSRNANPPGGPSFGVLGDLVLDPAQNKLYVVDSVGPDVLSVDPGTGTRSTVSDNANPASAPYLGFPYGIVVGTIGFGPVHIDPGVIHVDPPGHGGGGHHGGGQADNARVSLSVSEAATVTVTIDRMIKRRPRQVGTLSFAAPAGESTQPFSAQVGGRTLAPGGYRATLRARSAAGYESVPRSVAFSVRRR